MNRENETLARECTERPLLMELFKLLDGMSEERLTELIKLFGIEE